MKNDNIFMNVETIGNLYLYDVLIEYLYPRVFVCEDDYDSKYLFYEITDGEVLEWVVTKIKRSDYYDLIDRKSFIQKVISSNKTNIIIRKELIDSNYKISARDFDGNILNLLPKKEVYAEPRVTLNMDDTLEESRNSKMTIFDIKFYEGSPRHSVPAPLLNKVVESFKNLVGCISGKRNVPLRVATIKGSCIVRFSFDEKINLFDEYNSKEEIKIINELLVDNNLSKCLDQIKNKKNFILNYKKMLDALKKEEVSVKIMSATPTSSASDVIDLSKETLDDYFNSVKDIYDIKIESKNFRGRITSWNVKTRRFTFNVDGNYISGEIADDLKAESSIDFNSDYYIECEIESQFDANNENIKKSYKLTSYNLV